MSKKKVNNNKKDFHNVMDSLLSFIKVIEGDIPKDASREYKMWADVLQESQKRNHINDIATSLGGRTFSKSFKSLRAKLNDDQKSTLSQGLKDIFVYDYLENIVLCDIISIDTVRNYILESLSISFSDKIITYSASKDKISILLSEDKTVVIYLIDPNLKGYDFAKSFHIIDFLIIICDHIFDDKFLLMLKEWLKHIRAGNTRLIADIQAQIIQILEKRNQPSGTEEYLRKNRDYYKSKFEELEKSVKSIIDDKNKLQNKIKTQEQVIESVGCLFLHAQEIYRSYKSGNNKE